MRPEQLRSDLRCMALVAAVSMQDAAACAARARADGEDLAGSIASAGAYGIRGDLIDVLQSLQASTNELAGAAGQIVTAGEAWLAATKEAARMADEHIALQAAGAAGSFYQDPSPGVTPGNGGGADPPQRLAVQFTGGGEIVAQPTDDGHVRLQLTSPDGAGNDSGPLHPHQVWEFADQLVTAAEFDDGVRRTNAVHTYPRDENGQATGLATGFAQVTYPAGGGPLQVELLHTDAAVPVTADEARRLAEDLRRHGEPRPVHPCAPGGTAEHYALREDLRHWQFLPAPGRGESVSCRYCGYAPRQSWAPRSPEARRADEMRERCRTTAQWRRRYRLALGRGGAADRRGDYKTVTRRHRRGTGRWAKPQVVATERTPQDNPFGRHRRHRSADGRTTVVAGRWDRLPGGRYWTDEETGILYEDEGVPSRRERRKTVTRTARRRRAER